MAPFPAFRLVQDPGPRRDGAFAVAYITGNGRRFVVASRSEEKMDKDLACTLTALAGVLCWFRLCHQLLDLLLGKMPIRAQTPFPAVAEVAVVGVVAVEPVAILHDIEYMFHPLYGNQFCHKEKQLFFLMKRKKKQRLWND